MGALRKVDPVAATGEPPQNEPGFAEFFRDAEPRLRRALVGRFGHDRGRDAAADALAWGYEHRHQLETMTNPIGYLYRVGVSATRGRRHDVLFDHDVSTDPVNPFEPALASALRGLSPKQRVAVVLVSGYGYTLAEVAQITESSVSTVNTHHRRGLAKIRSTLGLIEP